MDEALQLGIAEGLLAIAFVMVCAIVHTIFRRVAQREADHALEQHFLGDRPPQLTYRGANYQLSENEFSEEKGAVIAQIPVQYRGNPTCVIVSSADQIPEGVTQLKYRGIPYIRLRPPLPKT